jgi:polysaccharide biosynthesis/export protein
MKKIYIILFLISIMFFYACKNSKSNVILQTNKDDVNWSGMYSKTLKEYKIKEGDKIELSLFTNMGEAMIDPSGKLVAKASTGTDGGRPEFFVGENGLCNFPMIGHLEVVGMTTLQLDSILNKKYEEYYNDVYVITKVTNKRIIVFNGVNAMVVPFENQHMTLLEVIAIAGGFPKEVKAYNIRVVRGDLKNPEVAVVNLKSIQDMKSTIISLQPDDIVYIEPVRKVFTESMRDNMFVFQIIQISMWIVIFARQI